MPAVLIKTGVLEHPREWPCGHAKLMDTSLCSQEAGLKSDFSSGLNPSEHTAPHKNL